MRWSLPGALLVAAACSAGPGGAVPSSGGCCGQDVLANGLRIAESRYLASACSFCVIAERR
jgi:hypothetical protein